MLANDELELRRTFKILIDERPFEIHDPEVNGRQLLNKAEKRPADDFIIYYLGHDNILEDMQLDDMLRLHPDQVSRFLTFESDRSYRFEIDGKREDWGAPIITEETVRKLAGGNPEARVWLERRNEPDRLLKKGDSVNLTEAGTERFYLEKGIKVSVVNEENGDEFGLEAFKDTKLDALFAEIYKRLNRPRCSDDRLRCEEGGSDVFQFGNLTVGQYTEAGHCRCLVWLFAGGTGGAVCL